MTLCTNQPNETSKILDTQDIGMIPLEGSDFEFEEGYDSLPEEEGVTL